MPVPRLTLALLVATPFVLSAQTARVRRPVRERPGSSGPAAAITRPGDFWYTIQHGGLVRAYRVHVPRSWRPNQPTPMILALHGGGGNMNHQARDEYYGLITKSEEAGFLVVFPNGYSRLRSGMIATWNAGNCCGQARDRNIDDVGFLRAVIAEMGRKVTLDRDRIFAIGMSNGGLMSYRLACEASDVIRGIMAVAGTDNTRECRPAQPVPVLHVHARNDDHVLFNGGSGASLRDPSAVTPFVSVPATIEKWVALNRAARAPRRVVSLPGAYCDLHEALAGGAPVQLCVTETGMHSWPGGQKARAAEPPSQAIRANDVMWDFFSSLSTPGPQPPR